LFLQYFSSDIAVIDGVSTGDDGWGGGKGRKKGRRKKKGEGRETEHSCARRNANVFEVNANPSSPVDIADTAISEEKLFEVQQLF